MTWLEEQLKIYDNYDGSFRDGLKEGYKDCAYDLSKKILQKLKSMQYTVNDCDEDNCGTYTENTVVNVYDIKELLKSLGALD